ncbi:MAG: prolipoprotein diacylglyceryl transferase [Dichotomicrobium sp.]
MTDSSINLAALPFPNIDPVAISLGPADIRWYGLAYLAGLILGWLYMRRLAGSPLLWNGASPVKPAQIDDFLIWATLGVVVGGRLGFVIFYQPEFFLAHPLEIFAVWGGGMSFHGGLIGVGVATYFFARYNGIPVFSLMDLSAAAVPFGLFFGRIANFINGEIYGRLTDVPWAVVFPQRVLEAGHALGPRHPTQIYEALLEGVVLFLALRYLTHYRGALMRPGVVVGAFLMIYGAARIFVEFAGKIWRYDFSVLGIEISVGTVYSLPMIALGLYFVMRAMRHEKLATQ